MYGGYKFFCVLLNMEGIKSLDPFPYSNITSFLILKWFQCIRHLYQTETRKYKYNEYITITV